MNMVLTKKYLEQYQNNTRKTVAQKLLLQLGQPALDDDGHLREYSEQDIFEQVRKAFQQYFEEVKT